MSRVALIAAAVASSAIAAIAAAQMRASGEVRPGQVVVLAELFTSEGCSSCPPADRLLETLLKEQPVKDVYIVPLSEHVTYWDHQGWKDPFSAEQYTTRQKEYGFRFNLDSIYTPQLVIDGSTELIGSDEGALQRALAQPGAVKPYLQVDAAGFQSAIEVVISGPGLSRLPPEAAELMVAVTEDDLAIDVKRGENAGRKMHHSGVVRSLQSLGDPRSQSAPKGAVDSQIAAARTVTLALQPDWQRAKLRVVAFVQSKKTSRVLSVGWQAIK